MGARKGGHLQPAHERPPRTRRRCLACCGITAILLLAMMVGLIFVIRTHPRRFMRYVVRFQDYAFMVIWYLVRPFDSSRLTQGRGLDVPASLDGRYVLVTGGTKGLGFYVAKNCYEKGAHVVLTGRSAASSGRAAAKLEEETGRHGGAVGLPLNLADFGAVREFAADLIQRYPTVNHLYLNAGCGHTYNAKNPWADEEYISASGHNRVLAANHLGHFLLTVLLAPHIASGGSIVVVSSLNAWYSNPQFKANGGMMTWWGTPPTPIATIKDKGKLDRRLGSTAYEDSKFANICFAHSLRAKLSKRRVRSNVLHPGLVETELAVSAVDYDDNTSVTADIGGLRVFESAFVTVDPQPDFIYPYWFPAWIYKYEAPESRAPARSKRWPAANGYLFEGPRAYIVRPQLYSQRRDFTLHASVGPECSAKLERELWVWSRMAVGLPESVDDGDLFSIKHPPPIQAPRKAPAKASSKPKPNSKSNAPEKSGNAPRGGALFPSFEVPDQDGNHIRLSSFSGKKILLVWCGSLQSPACLKQANGLQRTMQRWTSLKIQVLGSSPGTPEESRRFRDSHGLKFPWLSDVARTLPKKMQADGPWAVLLGEKRKIIRFWALADPATLADVVLQEANNNRQKWGLPRKQEL